MKLRYLFENFPLAKTALENWEHDNDSLDEFLAQFRISSNAIYPFAQNGKRCYLRLAPVEEKSAQNIKGELHFIEYLIQKGYPALKPIPSLSGTVLKELATPWGAYYASAFEGVSGKPIEATDYSDEIMREYGRSLGWLHALSSAYCPKIKKWTHLNVLDWIEKTIQEYHAPSSVFEKLEQVKTKLSALPVNSENYVLVHYDFELDNVFYDEKTKSCSVIDFDDSMYHWYAIDVDQVFDSLAEELREEKLERAKAQFLEGYRSEWVYSEEMEESRPIMRRFCRLFTYARLIRSVSEQFRDEPDWLIDLRKKLEKYIRELETGMQS